ncbi:unnamed protein product [[Actinomadura] parvosata subsp. kistnae]|uniref:Uncharacterized protein n=1 Tax=[Actinomadura] parvosata subsp. kistnae TaxID=1909395 RepID=A0A1U9ZXB6_9ACTN|nr:hypothetical protein [Nonomuraea sp. ATCC 55076]AQZ62596.1 hypothetical protein BKM31_15015 [Nonomuraea sp. ATCC 55076]SPL88877.1 unnamed protein product [Actinomadura parvosata subsp. kistnae]
MRERDAAAALAHADGLGAKVRQRSQWYGRFLVLYSVAAFFVVLVIGLNPGPVGAIASMAIWAPALTGLVVYAFKQPVTRAGFTRRHLLIIGSWTALYLAVLFPGTAWFEGNLAWWLPGALVVAIPGLIGAYVEVRR